MTKKLLTLLLGCMLLVSGAFASFSVEVISTNPAPVTAGDYADITLRFTNVGSAEQTSEAKNVQFSIKETNLIKPLGNEDAFFSKVFAKESITRTFRVYFSEDLNEGFIEVPVLIKTDSINTEKKVKIYIEEESRKPELLVGSIDTAPNQLLRNSENNVLQVSILNLGDRNAELVKATLNVESDLVKPSQAFSMEDSLASISSGGEGVLEFEIDIEDNASAQIIEASIDFTYRTRTAVGDNYETVSSSLNFDLPIDESPYLIVEDVKLLDSFVAGSVDNRVELTITNIGEEEAEDVRVRVSPDISFPLVFSQTTQYLSASLNPGESATMIFEMEVVADANPREYVSKVVIESMVGETRYSQDTTLSITTQESNKASEGSVGTILLVVVLLISILIGFNVYREKTKSKK